MGSETWSTILPKFQGQRMGLTATPDRPDGMDKAYRVHAGKVLYKYTKQQLKSEFVFVHTGLNIPTPRIRNPMKRWAMVQSYVGKHEPRNHMIANFLQEAFLEGRKLIVLGERVATLRWLCKGYPGKNKAVYNGDLPIAGPERAEALSKRAIFATASMAKEGLDVPSLDTLFITIPFSGVGRLSQSVGRILRVHDGKQAPRTYVFVDQHPSIRRNAQGMREWALKKGYAVKDIYPGDF